MALQRLNPASLSLSALQQERLHVFVLSAGDGRPIRRIPVFGEVDLSLPNPYYAKADLADNDLAEVQNLKLSQHFEPIRNANRKVAQEFGLALSTRVDLYGISRSGNLTAWDEFVKLVIKGLRDVKLVKADDPPAGFEKLVDSVVDKAATTAGLTPPTPNISVARMSMGCLSTDHAGFVSFDLTRLKSLITARLSRLESAHLSFFMSHNIINENRIEVLQNAAIGARSIVARITIDAAKSPSRPALSLPSLQNPSLIDWQTSPGSFAAVPGSLVGTDGCEGFTPSNFATQTFPLRQLHRLVGDSGIQVVSAEFPPALVIEYKVTITPIGHSLGELSYSLPLAPGETVRLAIIDWRHDASTNRAEDTKFTEGLIHDQARDRTISETVHAALDEWQRGGSVMGGVAAGAGGAASSGSAGGSAGGAASIGGAYSTSSGTRDLSADTVQKIADAIHQASAATRELVSTVVVQTDEKESESIQTRSFSNNNRGHTMTVLYYELLRHYHLKVEFSKYYEAVMVPRSKFSWIARGAPAENWNFRDEAFLLAKQYLLKPALLDQSLLPAFDAIQRLAEQRRKIQLNPPPIWDGDKEFIRFKMDFSIIDPSPDSLRGYIVTLNATDTKLTWVSDQGPIVDDLNTDLSESKFSQKNTSFTLTSGDLAAPIKWRDLTQFYFMMGGDDDLTAQIGNVLGIFKDGGGSVDLVPQPGKGLAWTQPGDRQDVAVVTRPPPPPPPAPAAENSIPSGDFNLIEMLKNHLDLESDYYSRVLDFAVPYYSYASEFDKIKVDANTMLLNYASPRPLEMLGNLVAFPRLTSGGTLANRAVIDRMYQDLVEPEERLISLPARGLFAEAKLGHCNVAEEIDESLFWRWDEHPLPLVASDIAAVQPVQPHSDPPKADPTNFPTSIVNIQQPPAEPDPQGMAAALKAITTPDIFRNMSGIAQVQAMLHDLTEAAVSMAQAASKNLDNAQKNSNQASGNDLAHEENMARISNDNKRAASNQTTPSEAAGAIQQVRKEAQRGTITAAERDKIVKDQLGNMKGSSSPPPPPKVDPPPDPLRPRQLYLTVRNALNAGVYGRYSVDLFQAATANGTIARVNAEPGEGVVEEWKDGSRLLKYTPVLNRPLFFLSLIGDVKADDAATDAMVFKGHNLSLDMPADAWARFDFNSVVLTLQTDKRTIRSKSTDDTATKLAASGKLNGTISGGFGVGVGVGPWLQKALSRIVKIVIKDASVNATTGGDLGVEWTPFDEKKSFTEEKEMTVTFYTGAVSITEIK